MAHGSIHVVTSSEERTRQFGIVKDDLLYLYLMLWLRLAAVILFFAAAY